MAQAPNRESRPHPPPVPSPTSGGREGRGASLGEGKGGGDEQLRLHLQGLQHKVQRSSAWVRRLIVLAGALIVMLTALLIALRVHYVMQYAPLEEIHFAPAPSVSPPEVGGRYRGGAVEISYVPQATGKVEFLRQAAHQTETLIEHVEDVGAKKTFVWAGVEGETYTLTARYRQGWSVVEKKWSPAK